MTPALSSRVCTETRAGRAVGSRVRGTWPTAQPAVWGQDLDGKWGTAHLGAPVPLPMCGGGVYQVQPLPAELGGNWFLSCLHLSWASVGFPLYLCLGTALTDQWPLCSHPQGTRSHSGRGLPPGGVRGRIHHGRHSRVLRLSETGEPAPDRTPVLAWSLRRCRGP